MIRHIVFFGVAKQQDTQAVIEGLKLLRNIGEHRLFEVRANLKRDGFNNEVDVVFYSEFETEAHLQRFIDHPLYQECINRVRPLRSIRYCADIKS